WRLRQEEIAEGGMGQLCDRFELLQRRLGFAGDPEGPLREARREFLIAEARALGCPAQHRDRGGDFGHTCPSAVGVVGAATKPAASSGIVIGGHVLVAVKISCLPRWAKSESSALKAEDWVKASKRKSRRWNLPLPR